MRKTIFSVLMCCVAIVSVSSSSLLAQGQQNEIKVLERAEELVGAMYHGDAGKVWDVMTPWTRAEVSRRISREEYIKTIAKLFEQIKITNYDSSRLVFIGEKYAVTQAQIAYEFREGNQVRQETSCERTLWLKFPEGWYWQKTNLVCDYMPSANEIKRLTKNLK